jgi:hypothetical protein
LWKFILSDAQVNKAAIGGPAKGPKPHGFIHPWACLGEKVSYESGLKSVAKFSVAGSRMAVRQFYQAMRGSY